MSKTKMVDRPFIITLCNEENKALAGIPVRLGSRCANTDLSGEALFLGLEPGEYELGIDAADFRPLRKKMKLDRNAKNFGLILQDFAKGGIKGNVRLLGAGLSLPDAEVQLKAVRPEETGAEEFRFWTDWDGHYASGSIPVGEYEYQVNAAHCEFKQGKLKIEKDSVLTLDADLKPVPSPAKITVKVKTESGAKVKKCRVRLLEGMGAVLVAEKEGRDVVTFTDIDRAPFNQQQPQKKPFIGRNFVAAADMEGYHTGYAAGSLRSQTACDLVVICRKRTPAEPVIKGMEEPVPAEVPLNEALKVQIPCERKERLVKILLPHAGNVTVKAGPNPYHTFLTILDKNLKKLADTWNYANQPVERTVQSAAGELLIGISGEIRDAAEVLSSLRVEYQPIIDPYQPNHTFESALPVEFGEAIRPFIFPQEDVKFFMVEVRRPGILRARLTGCTIHARVRILNPAAEEMASSWNYANQPVDVACPVYKPGLYRIVLSGTNPGDYTLASAYLKIDFIGTEASPLEFGPDPSPAKPIKIGKWFDGTLFPGGKSCRYSLNLDRNGFIKIRFQLSGCHSRLRVLTAKGNEIYSSWNYAGQALNPDIAIQESGDYFIEITGTDASQQSQGNFFSGVYFYPNDEYEGYQGNNSPETAALIHLGQEVTGTIERPGDVDYYRFYVDHPGLLLQSTRPFPIHLYFIVNDPQGKEIFNSWNYAGQNLDREYQVLNRGYHTLRVLGTNPNDYSPASYGFRLENTRVKPESVQTRKTIVLDLNSGLKLDALIPGGIKAFVLPVNRPGTVTLGAKIPIHARLIVSGPDGKELFNSWNYAGQPLQTTLKLDDPTALPFTVQGTNPGDWSKECYFIYAADGDRPPEPALTVERIADDNRSVAFNVSGTPAEKHKIIKYELDFEGTGKFKKVAAGLVEHSYPVGKLYTPCLRITDDRGAVGIESLFLDLLDVRLSGLSCRIAFPQNGVAVAVPASIFAQAASGPGKPVKSMKLYLDNRLLAANERAHIEAELPWKSLISGSHTVKVTALSADGQEAQDSATFKMAEVFDLWPENGKVITGSRAVITWFSAAAGETLVAYRKVGAADFKKVAAQKGREHKVVLEGLDAGVMYEFRAGDGKTWSETRTFTLQKGLSFERPRYGVTIPREYGQSMPVTVRNNSDHPLKVILECRPPEDEELLVGFVGEGSEDRPIDLPPGEIRQFLLSLSAQDCIRELHRFAVRIRSKDGYSDQAEVEVRVKIPRVDLQWEELETNPNTLAKKLRIINKGDGLTDLTVRIVPAGAFRLRPIVEHALLPANAALELWADPVLYDGFKKINGEVKIETFGKTFSHQLDCAVPAGRQVYRVTVDPTWWEEIRSWFCTNRPVISLISKAVPYLVKGLETAGSALSQLAKENAKYFSYLSKKFKITDAKAIVRDDKLEPVKYKKGDKIPPGKKEGDEVIIPKDTEVRLTHFRVTRGKTSSGELFEKLYVYVEGYGWTSAANLKGSINMETFGFCVPEFVSMDPLHQTVGAANGKYTDEEGKTHTIAQGTQIMVKPVPGDKDHAGQVRIASVKSENGQNVEDQVLGWIKAGDLVPNWVKDIKGPNSAWSDGKYKGEVTLIRFADNEGNLEYITKDTFEAFTKMAAAYAADVAKGNVAGVAAQNDPKGKMELQNSFRTFARQANLRDLWEKDNTRPGANKAGYSKHQVGDAMDLNNPSSGRDDPRYKWMQQHASEYGISWPFKTTQKKEDHHWIYSKPKTPAPAPAKPGQPAAPAKPDKPKDNKPAKPGKPQTQTGKKSGRAQAVAQPKTAKPKTQSTQKGKARKGS